MVFRQDIGEADAHACCGCPAKGLVPYNAGIDGHDFSIVGQLQEKIKPGIDRQGITGFNKRAGGAQVGYARICAYAGRAGYEPQVGFYSR